jgi:hypothetical protein
MFDDETTIDVDVDTLGEDAVWQEEKLEFEDVEEPGEDKVEQVQGRLEELQINRRASGLPVTWGTRNVQSADIAKSRGRQLLGPRS